MTNINFATATSAELEAAGFTVITKKSQAKTRRTRKSVWGVKATANKKGCKKATLSQMNEDSTGTIR